MEHLTWDQVKAAAQRSGRLRGVYNKGGAYELISIQYPDALHEAMLQKTDAPADWYRTLKRMNVPVAVQLILM